MKKLTCCLLGTLFLLSWVTRSSWAQKNPVPLFAKQNLVAWCIVPYDSVKRTPEQRAQMLQELGIKKFAYDWRDQHLPTMAQEITTMRQAGIQLKSVWFWVNGGSDQVLDKTNEFILETLKQQKAHTELWLSFNEKYFAGLTDQEKLKKAVTAVDYINKRAQAINCTLMLYNHGDWFGEPENQIKIIKAIGAKNLGMVYNFHHAHEQVKNFPALLRQMKPYLTTVNINGMRSGGPKILPLGKGDLEEQMLKDLKASGFTGSLGIIGHTENEDVKQVLEGNLIGLKQILKNLGETAALQTY
ncbi:sugar phosphate isomerase/epimerase family protein [Adhaeribacter radiodurans]|uniref:TIM barrel protein n=1 Tax=Adhaeribacter radiodurans TaxID=2745197 RepID=A0A7L7L9X1_9BACT|nr:TIM barrel protein [Adhaeribacter radiodurans]QMU29642.1 TIM barrel protein [Adhaeribacter radiodurans]